MESYKTKNKMKLRAQKTQHPHCPDYACIKVTRCHIKHSKAQFYAETSKHPSSFDLRCKSGTSLFKAQILILYRERKNLLKFMGRGMAA